ncbi:MAG: O-antigen ligase family protein [Actinomycetota bacterium]
MSSTGWRTAASPARVDAIGAALLGALVAWTFASAAIAGGSPVPVAAVVLACAAALVVGRATGRFARWLVPAAVAASAAVLILTPKAFTSAPLQGPFGYANAAGAFFALASVASAVGAVTTRIPAVRAAWIAAAAVFAAVPLVRGSLAAAALLTLPALALLLARDPSRSRAVVAGCAGLFVLTLFLTIVLGVSGGGGARGNEGGAVESALSGRRLALWHDALSIMAEHPVAGVGPGRFAEVSDVAARDPDARWAHHEFLQQGAEEGVVGLVLLVALVLWGFARSWVTPSADVATALGASALALVAIHACVDYVLHFPAIPVAAAALLGATQATVGRRGRARTERDEADLVGA